MLYLKRKIDAFLAEWKANPDRKPLIVKGPRQVGKTESIKRTKDRCIPGRMEGEPRQKAADRQGAPTGGEDRVDQAVW